MSSRDYIMITLAALIYGFGFSAFILPEKVVIGGVTGLGTIVYFLTGNPYLIGITQYAINIVLLVIAWKVVAGPLSIRLFTVLLRFRWWSLLCLRYSRAHWCRASRL